MEDRQRVLVVKGQTEVRSLPMTPNAKRISCGCVAALMLIVSLYAAMGVLQAGSIYVGGRALQNLRFWGSITVLSLIVSVVSGLCALRSSKERQ